MTYETLLVARAPKVWTLTLNRPARQNAITGGLLGDLNRALDAAEANEDCRVVVIKGQGGTFCTGMDLAALVSSSSLTNELAESAAYMAILKRFALSPKIIVADVDGVASAGGLGFVAASDLAVASERSVFSLPEALWGLLPAAVIPYLIRRVGFRRAYVMTLTMQSVSAKDALGMGLVDEVSGASDEFIRRLVVRLARLQEQTIVDLKAYFRKTWIVDDAAEKLAVDEFTRLAGQPRVQANIMNFVNDGIFPWQGPPTGGPTP